MENNNSDPEHFFGLVHADLTPKPAWEAYKTLVKMRPVNSTLPVCRMERRGVRIAEWVKPDGGAAAAIWVTGAATPVKLKLHGTLKSACDYLGNPVKTVAADDGTVEATASNY